MGTIHVRIAVNLICLFSYANHIYVSIYIFAINRMYFFICIYISMTLFVCHFSIFGSCFLHSSASFSLTFTFTNKFDCGIIFTPKISFVLSVISIITILVKLLQMIWGYHASYMEYQSLCLYLKDLNFTL